VSRWQHLSEVSQRGTGARLEPGTRWFQPRGREGTMSHSGAFFQLNGGVDAAKRAALRRQAPVTPATPPPVQVTHFYEKE
jgi:hypothetical protein